MEVEKLLARKRAVVEDNCWAEVVHNYLVDSKDNRFEAGVDSCCCNTDLDADSLDSLVQDWDYKDKCCFCCAFRVVPGFSSLVRNIEFPTFYT